jgi:hypothetical protein
MKIIQAARGRLRIGVSAVAVATAALGPLFAALSRLYRGGNGPPLKPRRSWLTSSACVQMIARAVRNHHVPGMAEQPLAAGSR